MEFAPRRAVPVFPLPNVVLFPRTVLPLHVFERRYRTLVRDALSGERMIVIALLKPGWESEYYAAPAFHELGCLGRCEAVEWRPDDCYDVKLAGVVRVRVGRPEMEFPYRSARVEPVPQAPFSEDDPLVQSEGQALKALHARLPRPSRGAEGPAGPESAGFESLVNTLAMALAIEPLEKQRLLEMDSLIERCRRVRTLVGE